MKTYFILLALVLSAVISYGQASKKFIYTPSKEREGRYIVSPSFEEPRNEALKTSKSQIAYVRTYEFGKVLFPQGFFSMVKSAVSSEKLTQLRKLQETDKWKRMGISFKYSGRRTFGDFR